MPRGGVERSRAYTAGLLENERFADWDAENVEMVLDEALKNLYDGVSQEELSTSLVITARTLIEREPNYSYAAARLLLDNLRAEGVDEDAAAGITLNVANRLWGAPGEKSTRASASRTRSNCARPDAGYTTVSPATSPL